MIQYKGWTDQKAGRYASSRGWIAEIIHIELLGVFTFFFFFLSMQVDKKTSFINLIFFQHPMFKRILKIRIHKSAVKQFSGVWESAPHTQVRLKIFQPQCHSSVLIHSTKLSISLQDDRSWRSTGKPSPSDQKKENVKKVMIVMAATISPMG